MIRGDSKFEYLTNNNQPFNIQKHSTWAPGSLNIRSKYNMLCEHTMSITIHTLSYFHILQTCSSIIVQCVITKCEMRNEK